MQRDTLNAKLKDIYMNHRDRLDVAMADSYKYLSIWHLKYLVAYDEM
jgi:hypothetical protein